MKVEDYVNNTSDDDFEENRDYLMKAVEKDLKLIALICWALEITYKEYSYQQMIDYISTVTLEELEEHIELKGTVIDDAISTTTILDIFYRIKENGKTIGYLDIENQTDLYPLDEIEARSIFNLFTIVYHEKGEDFKSTDYRDMIAPKALWIFPSSSLSRQNTVQVGIGEFPAKEFKYDFNNKKVGKPEEIKPDYDIKLEVFRCYLGEPDELDLDFKEVTDDDKSTKLRILILLLDILFTFGLSKEERLRMLKEYFNLTGEATEKVVQAMTALDAILKVREENWKEKIAKLEEEIDKLREENAKMREESTNARNQLAEYKERNK